MPSFWSRTAARDGRLRRFRAYRQEVEQHLAWTSEIELTFRARPVWADLHEIGAHYPHLVEIVVGLGDGFGRAHRRRFRRVLGGFGALGRGGVQIDGSILREDASGARQKRQEGAEKGAGRSGNGLGSSNFFRFCSPQIGEPPSRKLAPSAARAIADSCAYFVAVRRRAAYPGARRGRGLFIEQFRQFLGHRAAQLLRIDNRDRASIVSRHVIADADRDQSTGDRVSISSITCRRCRSR